MNKKLHLEKRMEMEKLIAEHEAEINYEKTPCCILPPPIYTNASPLALKVLDQVEKNLKDQGL